MVAWERCRFVVVGGVLEPAQERLKVVVRSRVEVGRLLGGI